MAKLLTADDSAAFEILNPTAASNLIFVADHASNKVPLALNNLGLPQAELDRHIGIDIGSAWIAAYLTARFDALAVCAGFSRLVIDLNRQPTAPSSIPDISDGTYVPGNKDLTSAYRQARVDEIFWPYHAAIETAMTAVEKRGQTAILISLHSFTPVINGHKRPWDIGFLYDQDARLSQHMITTMQQDGDIFVGENQPYSGKDPQGFTVNNHRERPHRPSLVVEFRQDLVATQITAEAWADRFANAVEKSLAAAALSDNCS